MHVGYVLPLSIRSGLPYLNMHPPTDKELDDLPHVIMTSNVKWDQTTLDTEADINATIEIAAKDKDSYHDSTFDKRGENICHLNCLEFLDTHSTIDDVELTKFVDCHNTNTYLIHSRDVTTRKVDYEEQRLFFEWAPADIIKCTYKATTQYARNIYCIPFCKQIQSRFPVLNVFAKANTLPPIPCTLLCPPLITAQHRHNSSWVARHLSLMSTL